MKKIMLTGGGTAGHVTPNMALLPALRDQGFHIVYVGSHTGMEKELIEQCNVPFYGIASGKLRRYLSAKNITDVLNVVKGLGDALKLVRTHKPTVIFSKGGFVTVPVVVAGWLCGVPVVLHESDLSPGLANKIAMPFAKAVCVNFPETLAHVGRKGVVTGTPIRAELFTGDKAMGLALCGFHGAKPVLLVVGGSTGSKRMNDCVRAALPQLLAAYQVVHLCGKGNLDLGCTHEGYKQFDYVSEALPHLLAATDLVVSRAGANAICEFLALAKPCLLIPLSKSASRGDQIDNAASFARQGFAQVLAEEGMTTDTLVAAVSALAQAQDAHRQQMANSQASDGVRQVMAVLNSMNK